MLSSARNAYEYPTLLLARQEMASWRHLQLEPSALGAPDRVDTAPGLRPDGGHLAATLHHLAQRAEGGAQALYSHLAARLDALLGGVRSFEVLANPQRGRLDLRLIDHQGTAVGSRALSDGSLRYLALCALEVDPSPGGLVCLEEPASGIHPQGMNALLALLCKLAADPLTPAGPHNLLRQVILNSYSPALLAGIDDDDLLLARALDGASFSWCAGTWRDAGTEDDPRSIPVEAWDELFTQQGVRQPTRSAARRAPCKEEGPQRQVTLFPS